MGSPPVMETDPREVGLDPVRLRRLDHRMARYVDAGQLPGFSVLVARHGRVAHLCAYGRRDVDADLPMELDTIARIYSMTKPVTAVAALMLWEEGAFELTTRVGDILPAFAVQRVFRGGTVNAPETAPVSRPMTVGQLLSHTSGLTYGFHRQNPVDALYRRAGFGYGTPDGIDLAAACDAYAALPLLFEPGTEWNYSVSTDVLGRVVEVLSGQTLPEFFERRIFAPLGMADTGFSVRPEARGRLATVYAPKLVTGGLRRDEQATTEVTAPPMLASGGGGLVSTLADYQRFAQMLLGGGHLEGVRLLSDRTVSHLSRNQLPGGADLRTVGRPLVADMRFDGLGFGLGVAVILDPVRQASLGSVGEYGWAGAANTSFFIDPLEDMTMVFFTQLQPPHLYPLRSQLDTLVHQALVD